MPATGGSSAFLAAYRMGDNFNEDLRGSYGAVGSLPPLISAVRGPPRPPASIPHVASRTPSVPMPESGAAARWRSKVTGSPARSRADANSLPRCRPTGRSANAPASGCAPRPSQQNPPPRKSSRRRKCRRCRGSTENESGRGRQTAPSESKNAPDFRGVFALIGSRGLPRQEPRYAAALSAEPSTTCAAWALVKSECCGASWPRGSRGRDRREAGRSRAKRSSPRRNRQAGMPARRRSAAMPRYSTSALSLAFSLADFSP